MKDGEEAFVDDESCWKTAGVVSAPLYDSSNYRFAGMFTLVDIIHLIQYYYLSKTTYDSAAVEVESVDLSMLRGAHISRRPPCISAPALSVLADLQPVIICTLTPCRTVGISNRRRTGLHDPYPPKQISKSLSMCHLHRSSLCTQTTSSTPLVPP